MRMRGAPFDLVPDYLWWDWAGKFALARRQSWRFFGITYRNQVQGAIVISVRPIGCEASVHTGRDGLCVEFLATAPWNIGRFMRSMERKPFLDAVGPILLRVAVSMSRATYRCEGRIVLFFVKKAEYFYRNVCGMIDLGVVHHGGETLRHCEMSKERADEFMGGG